MNILDEDIDAAQCQQLRRWNIHFQRIGIHVGRLGMKDRNELVPLLHRLSRPTFFSRDHGFYDPQLRHPAYGIVFLDVCPDECASYIRRVLRHRAFRTRAQRLGRVVRARPSGITYWQINEKVQHIQAW